MEDGPYFYVLPNAFRNEVCQGFNANALIRAMVAKGWLKTQGGDRYTYKTRLPGMGDRTTNVYLLTPEIWGDRG
jgi:putative DNA primase/helicase